LKVANRLYSPTEFLAATIEAQGAISEERLAEAFDRIDSDDSGFISAENLRAMLGHDFPQEEIDSIIKEADLTSDNKISYAEFLALWEEKHEYKRDVAMKEIEELGPIWGSDRSSEPVSDLSADDVEESVVISRANFLEEKQLSERKVVPGAEKHVNFKDAVTTIPVPDDTNGEGDTNFYCDDDNAPVESSEEPEALKGST